MFNIGNNQEFLEAIGIANAPEQEKQKLIAGLEELASKRLAVKIADSVSEEQITEFNSIENKKSAYDWMTKNVPELPSLITEVLAEMKDSILAHKTQLEK